jgi:hypothetical protein
MRNYKKLVIVTLAALLGLLLVQNQANGTGDCNGQYPCPDYGGNPYTPCFHAPDNSVCEYLQFSGVCWSCANGGPNQSCYCTYWYLVSATDMLGYCLGGQCHAIPMGDPSPDSCCNTGTLPGC